MHAKAAAPRHVGRHVGGIGPPKGGLLVPTAAAVDGLARAAAAASSVWARRAGRRRRVRRVRRVWRVRPPMWARCGSASPFEVWRKGGCEAWSEVATGRWASVVKSPCGQRLVVLLLLVDQLEHDRPRLPDLLGVLDLDGVWPLVPRRLDRDPAPSTTAKAPSLLTLAPSPPSTRSSHTESGTSDFGSATIVATPVLGIVTDAPPGAEPACGDAPPCALLIGEMAG